MNAPWIDRLLLYFDRGNLNATGPSKRVKNDMEPLFSALSDLAPLKQNNEAKEIHLRVLKARTMSA